MFKILNNKGFRYVACIFVGGLNIPFAIMGNIVNMVAIFFLIAYCFSLYKGWIK